MNKNKKQKIYLKMKLGISLSITFLLLLSCSIKWANYQNIFELEISEISGFNILNQQDYLKIIDQINKNADVDIDDIRQVLERNPFVKAARVSKHFPNNIKIQIAEREPLGIINIDNQLMIDNEGIILPGGSYSESYLIPVLSGFNSAKELYPEGEKTFSIKVKEAVKILKILSLKYPNLYENISELTLNKDDEYVMILANRPTRVILGKKDINRKLYILNSFDKALGQRQLTDFRLLDMRYQKQLVAREWT